MLFVVAVVAGRSGAGLGVADAVLLGAVEGLTEFLPISSTGHLIVVERLLGLASSPAARQAADAYAIAIQAGAIVAVAGLYRHRLASAAAGLARRDAVGRRLVTCLAVAFAPAALAGLVAGETIKDHLFGVGPVIAAWVAGGGLILAVSGRVRRHGRPLEAMGVGVAAAVGIAQSVALWPGVSRSLVTILAATAAGMSLPAAVEFSFLLGLVTLGAATALEIVTDGSSIVDNFGVVAPAAGFAAAVVFGVVAIRWMVGYLNSHSLVGFGWYRMGAAAVTGLLVLGGWL